MVDLPACPQCGQENTYADAALWICPDCGHEWNGEAAAEAGSVVRDSNGNRLAAGDTVVVIKDLKVKGSSITLKQGSKVKCIRLVSGGDHEVDCKLDAGQFMLKACFLKKVLTTAAPAALHLHAAGRAAQACRSMSAG